MSDELTGKIIGAAIEVHRVLGPGLLESIYEEALCHEFDLQGIDYKRQYPSDMHYKGHKLSGFKIDLLVEDKVIVENQYNHSCEAELFSQCSRNTREDIQPKETVATINKLKIK